MDVSKVGLDLAPLVDGDFLPKSINELRYFIDPLNRSKWNNYREEAPKKNIMVGTCEHEGLLFGEKFIQIQHPFHLMLH